MIVQWHLQQIAERQKSLLEIDWCQTITCHKNNKKEWPLPAYCVPGTLLRDLHT